MTNANCTQRFSCTCEILMFQDQASSFSAQVLFQPSIISSQIVFPASSLIQPRFYSMCEGKPFWNGHFPGKGCFQPRAFSRQKLFPGMYRFQPHADHPACTIRMQIDKQINVQDELVKAKQNKLQIANYKLKRDARRTGRRGPTNTYTAEVLWGIYPERDGQAECKLSALSEVPLSVYS